MEEEKDITQQSEVVEEEFLYLLDGYTLSYGYLLKGCKKPRKLYIHHVCLENIPQVFNDTETNILELFSSNLPEQEKKEENETEEEQKIMSPFKTRGILLLKLNSICRGNSPVQKETIQLLQKLYEEDILPIIPIKTRRSSSGNTYHISAVGRVLLGEGEVLYNNERKPTKEVFEQLQITPIHMKDPEYKVFIEGNEFNAMTIVEGYERIQRCLQSLAVGVSLGLLAKGKIGKSIESSFFHQFTMKGVSRLVNLIKNYLPRGKQPEEEIKGVHPMNTDPLVVDFACSFGRIFEVLLFVKEMISIELNGVRDNSFVVQRKEDIGISEPSWGNGSHSGIIAREIVGVSKELIVLCKRYESLLSSPLEMNQTEQKEKHQQEQLVGPFERSLEKVKPTLHQASEIIAKYLIQVKHLTFAEFPLESTKQLFEQFCAIEDEKMVDALKFGDITRIIRETHHDF